MPPTEAWPAKTASGTNKNDTDQQKNMKNRSFICYALDILGLVALVGAAFALAAALNYSASAAEPLLLSAFTYSLFITVAAFISARALELTRVFNTAKAAKLVPIALPPLADNVESLVERKQYPRAA